MHEILKRALDEALTVPYAKALSAESEKHVFSAEFERKMRALIRKTDHVYQKYIRIMAVAACAVIAVGCAVLLPRILENPIDVRPAETGEAVRTTSTERADEEIFATDDTVEEAADEAESDEDMIPEKAVEGESDEPTDLPADDTASEETTAPEGAPVLDQPAEEGSSEANSGYPSEAIVGTSTVPSVREPETTAPENTGAGSAPAGGESDDEIASDDRDAISAEDDDDGIMVGDSFIYDEEDDMADDADLDGDAAEYDVDDDDMGDDSTDSDDDDISYDDEEDTSTDDENSDASVQLPAIPSEKTLGEEVRAMIGCGLSESFLRDGYCLMDGEKYEFPIAKGFSEEIYRDEALAKLFEAAERTDRTAAGEELLSVRLGAVPPTIPAVNEFDFSTRKDYGFLFNGGDPEDEADSDVEDGDDAEECTLRVYTDGIVSITGGSYRGTAYYQLGDEAINRLTDRLETRFRIAEPERVGDLAALIGSKEDYARIVVRITEYYDCNMNGSLADGAFLDKLLKKYEKTKLSAAPPRDHTAAITVEIISRKALRRVSFEFNADGTVRFGGYCFTVKESEVRAILTEYCKQKSLDPPVFYETLGEYLSDKNFTKAIDAELFDSSVSESYALSADEKALEKLRKRILDRAGESAYLPEDASASSGRSGYIRLRLSGWSDSLTIYEDMIRVVGTTSCFKTPEGLYGELCELIRKNGLLYDAPLDMEEDTEDVLKDD